MRSETMSGLARPVRRDPASALAHSITASKSRRRSLMSCSCILADSSDFALEKKDPAPSGKVRDGAVGDGNLALLALQLAGSDIAGRQRNAALQVQGTKPEGAHQ